LDTGKAVVSGKERKVVAVDRKTSAGIESAKNAEIQRQKEKALFKATLKKQPNQAHGDDDDEWEDVEEDFPHVKLDELLDGLANLKIDDGSGEPDEDI
jgi:hypothetical protein